MNLTLADPYDRKAWRGTAIDVIIAEELEDDAPRLVGEHLDTLTFLFTALLQRVGERSLRGFLRHLRSVLGETPAYLYDLQARVFEAEERAAAASQVRAAAEDRLAGVVAARAAAQAESRAAISAIEAEIQQAKHELALERAAWEQECETLHAAIESEARRGSKAAREGVAELTVERDSWRWDHMQGASEIHALQEAIERTKVEQVQIMAELPRAWAVFAENKGRILNLIERHKSLEDVRAHVYDDAEREFLEECVAQSLAPRERRDALLNDSLVEHLAPRERELLLKK